MLQNLKNFFIAFLTGLVVFGLCAAWILSAIKNNDNNNSEKTGNKDRVQEYSTSSDDDSEEIDDGEDYKLPQDQDAGSAGENE